MTDSNQSTTTATNADPARHLRRAFWIVGSLLWAVAIVWLVVIQRAADESAAQGRRLSQSKLVGTDETSQPNEPRWDPRGIEDFSLSERSGRQVTKADLLGRPWAVCFVFTHCQSTCPRITSQFKRLQDRLGDADVRLVSLSVDPKNDSPERLRQYAETYQADPDRWLFLTGDQDAIYRLIKRSFRLPVHEMQGLARKPGFEVLHSNAVLHVDAQGRVVEKYDAMQDTDMIRLQRALLAEAKKLREANPTAEGQKN